MRASVWLQMVRRDFGLLDIMNESSTKIPWKVDYLFTAVVLKSKMCPISGYWISVLRFQSWKMKASVWIPLVRRDFGLLDILNESSTKIPWKVDYLFSAVVLKLKMCPISRYWISVHQFKSCTIKASVWLQLVRRDFGLLDIMNESSSKIPWKVDYLFTAVVLKLKLCPISGYWISVLQFTYCTMKASVWLQVVRRDIGLLDILNESSTKNPLKSRLSLHSCGTEIEDVHHEWILNFSTSIQVLHNESIGMTSAGSPWLRFVGYNEWK